MGFLGNIMDGLKVNQNQEEDDYFLDDDYYDDGEYYEEEAPKTGLFKGSRSADSGESRGVSFFGSRNKVTQIQNNAMQVTMKKPSTLDDSRDICDDLLDGKAVVINLEGINTDIAQRIIDFTYGAIYSIDGDLQMISKYIFIASPHSVELSGDFSDDFGKMGASSSSYMADTRAARNSGFSFNG